MLSLYLIVDFEFSISFGDELRLDGHERDRLDGHLLVRLHHRARDLGRTREVLPCHEGLKSPLVDRQLSDFFNQVELD